MKIIWQAIPLNRNGLPFFEKKSANFAQSVRKLDVKPIENIVGHYLIFWVKLSVRRFLFIYSSN